VKVRDEHLVGNRDNAIRLYVNRPAVFELAPGPGVTHTSPLFAESNVSSVSLIPPTIEFQEKSEDHLSGNGRRNSTDLFPIFGNGNRHHIRLISIVACSPEDVVAYRTNSTPIVVTITQAEAAGDQLGGEQRKPAVPHFTTLSRRGNRLSLPAKSAPKSAEPVHLVVDSTGLKIFGECEGLEQ
jgi:hypothetical protein